MRAYAVLAGGGVKGAALAGCLKAAEERGIEFVGYGGSSAGAIVALLAVVGYSADDLKKILIDTDFLSFFPNASKISDFVGDLQSVESKTQAAKVVWTHRAMLGEVGTKLGLDDGVSFKAFLLEKTRAKLADGMRSANDVTFQHLKEAKRPDLKVVVTDLQDRAPAVYSAAGGHERNGSAIDAVRASMSYPFALQPARGSEERMLVDGGLSTNLPIFLFERERKQTGWPLFAFDLVTEPAGRVAKYGIKNFLGDLAATALESADILQRQLLSNVFHVPVPIPASFETLNFKLTRAERENLFTLGHSRAHSFFSSMPHFSQANSLIEQLQALHVPPTLMQTALGALARAIGDASEAADVRAHIMLPTGHGTRIVVYEYGMGTSSDRYLELAMDGGCSGQAWSTRQPALADLEQAKTTYETTWKMTAAQQAVVRPELKSMLSVPIFDTPNRLAGSAEELDLLGVLSVDSTTALDQTGWATAARLDRQIREIMTVWADIAAEILG